MVTLLLLATFEPIKEIEHVIVPPMVQLGSGQPNSVALVWQTDTDNLGYSITFRQNGKERKAEASFKPVHLEGVKDHRVYSAELTNLTPGQRVSYQLVQGGKPVYTADFMAPKSASQPYTFNVFGDCGTGTRPQAHVAYQTFKAHPDLLVLTGDLVYNAGRTEEYQTRFYPYFASIQPTEDHGVPLFNTTLTAAAAGNHDILNRDFGQSPQALAYFYYWNQPLNGPLKTVGEKSTPTLSGPEDRKNDFLKNAGDRYPVMANYGFDYANAHWTVLDMNPYVDWTNPELRAWLKADLAKGKNKTWRFVALHQPGFHSSRSHQGEKQMRLVADLFDEANVDIVFCGHVHNYQRSKPIQLGNKKGATREELDKNDWPVDNAFDGKTVTRPHGVIYIVTGGGSAGLYNRELEKQPEFWNPFTAVYIGNYGTTHVAVNGGKLELTQVGGEGQIFDHIVVTK